MFHSCSHSWLVHTVSIRVQSGEIMTTDPSRAKNLTAFPSHESMLDFLREGSSEPAGQRTAKVKVRPSAGSPQGRGLREPCQG